MINNQYSLVKDKICQSDFFPLSDMIASLIDNEETADVTYF